MAAAGHESPFASIVGRRNGRTSTVWPMPIHCFAHGFGRTGEIGPMNDGALAAKYQWKEALTPSMCTPV
jgi:hypothetical protein